jgi:hypothetical protein
MILTTEQKQNIRSLQFEQAWEQLQKNIIRGQAENDCWLTNLKPTK